jgi:SAM-dependent methyltransferase
MEPDMAKLAYTKAIAIEDFSDPSLIPYLRLIAHDETVRFGLSEPPLIPDSKHWQCAMALRTFDEMELLQPGALFVGIGAGIEQTTFALASRGCVVFPTDRYLERTPWSDVAPPGMMLLPDNFSNFTFERGHVIPVHTDARALRLPSNMFHGVFSAGSVEHFGSLDAIEAGAEEIGRVLKPGGVAAISTEYRLDGPNDRAWFDDNCVLFTPELIERHIVRPSGLEIIGEPQWDTSNETFDGRVVLLDFLNGPERMQTVADKRNISPNLVLSHEGFLFCSVHLALRKPQGRPTTIEVGPRSRAWEPVVEAEAAAALRTLVNGLRKTPYEAPSSDPVGLDARIAALEAELHRFRTSRSYRLTQPLRSLADQVRRAPSLHRAAHSAADLVRSFRAKRTRS